MLSLETQRLIEDLGREEPDIREKARLRLVAIGGLDVTRALVIELVDPRVQVRWEAAKALTAIADPVSAPALMHALDDEDTNIRWIAAEGLIALGPAGLVTVLSGVMKRAASVHFCKGAHHVLHDLNMRNYSEDVAKVVESLDSPERAVAAPVAAYHALFNNKIRSSHASRS